MSEPSLEKKLHQEKPPYREDKKFYGNLEGQMIARLLRKGLKANWTEDEFIGFIIVMAGLHRQAKDEVLFEGLSPVGLATLAFCLEERKEGLQVQKDRGDLAK